MSILDQLIGQVLDEKYRIEERLGEGGMGAVYLATHLGTRRPVAVKVIAPQFMAHPEFVERFRREAEAAGRLCHPNVVNVTDFGFAKADSERLAYLVMEYLDGCSLGEVLSEESRLPLGFVVDILEQVCDAVDAAHRHGIIHRDLKPDNIWLEPNGRGGYTVKVLDFGLAKLGEAPRPRQAGEAAITMPPEPCVFEKMFSKNCETVPDNQLANQPALVPALPSAPAVSAITAVQPGSFAEEATQVQSSLNGDEVQTQAIPQYKTGGGHDDATTNPGLTRVGTLLGTPLYMSPEQCRGEVLDARSDIYSLGVIAYQMLAGQTPFSGNLQSLATQHMAVAPPALRGLRKDIPRPVAGLVMSCLAKNPEERPVSAAAFATALRANSEGIGSVLRQAIALYGEHFPTLFTISLIGYGPALFFSGLLGLNIIAMKYGFTPKFIGYALSGILGLLAIATDLFAKAVNNVAFVPVVAQVKVAPLRRIEVRRIFTVLQKRLGPLTTTAIRYYFTFILRLFKFVIPGIKALINYSLYAPVVMMEGLRGKEALERSQALVNRRKRVVVTFIILNALIGSKLVKIVSVFATQGLASKFGWAENSLTSQAMSSVMAAAACILINPLIAIAFALLYFNTRQAGGETLKEALGEEFSEEIPRSRWQLRMRERSRLRSRLLKSGFNNSGSR